jgi:DNA invertase Pin-like site-specific DNA recombinase
VHPRGGRAQDDSGTPLAAPPKIITGPVQFG